MELKLFTILQLWKDTTKYHHMNTEILMKRFLKSFRFQRKVFLHIFSVDIHIFHNLSLVKVVDSNWIDKQIEAQNWVTFHWWQV